MPKIKNIVPKRLIKAVAKLDKALAAAAKAVDELNEILN